MSEKNIPFRVINWDSISKTEHPGTTGLSHWQTLQLPGLRIRVIEYGPGYLADHWCQKGHIVHCVEGEFITEQEDGESFTIKQGMTYVVTDELSSHRSKTINKAKLLIIDGDFLKYNMD